MERRCCSDGIKISWNQLPRLPSLPSQISVLVSCWEFLQASGVVTGHWSVVTLLCCLVTCLYSRQKLRRKINGQDLVSNAPKHKGFVLKNYAFLKNVMGMTHSDCNYFCSALNSSLSRPAAGEINKTHTDNVTNVWDLPVWPRSAPDWPKWI